MRQIHRNLSYLHRVYESRRGQATPSDGGDGSACCLSRQSVDAAASAQIVWTRHLLGYCASNMQNVQGLSVREERLARDLTVLLRGFFRQAGVVQWFDLDLLLT